MQGNVARAFWHSYTSVVQKRGEAPRAGVCLSCEQERLLGQVCASLVSRCEGLTATKLRVHKGCVQGC